MYLIVETILSSTLGTVTILPIIIVIYTLNQIYRLILNLVLRFLYGGTITLNPTGYDGMYMYFGHPNGKRTVLYVATLESPIDLETHRQNYLDHVVNKEEYKKLRKIWIKKFGYHCLKEDINFDIKNHVRIYTGENNNKIITEDELMLEILPELSNDLDDSRPQWEDVIIPQFQYNNDNENIKSVRIFRIHHGYMDGISNLIMLAHSQSEGKAFPWVIDPLADPRSTKSNSKSNFFLYLQAISFRLLCLMNFSASIIKNIINSPSSLKNRWHIRNFTGKTTHGWSSPIEIATFRKIKDQSGASIPAIVCTILTNAIKRFESQFESRVEPSDPNLRYSDELIVGLVAALLPYKDLELRNNHCILKCHLDSRDFPEPYSRVRRLRVINKEIMRLGQLPDVYLNNLLPRLFGEMPGWFSDACTQLIAGCGAVSNFPAAKTKIKLWGNEVNEIAGFVPMLTPAGFACVTLRYADHLRFCMNADEASLTSEEMTFLLNAIAEEAVLLEQESTCRFKSEASIGDVIGRFVVSKVELEDDNCFSINNNNNNEYVKAHTDYETRFHAAWDKIMSTVSKLKRS